MTLPQIIVEPQGTKFRPYSIITLNSYWSSRRLESKRKGSHQVRVADSPAVDPQSWRGYHRPPL
jgi:hypothetical protein